VVAAAIEEHFQAGRHGMSLKACGDAVVFDIFGLAPSDAPQDGET
jgi:hypothetical protein